ncbi:MAG: hypothetical protein IT215_08990 [Chitinophagaceae bacterium]|nr:MAG: hypothetical protein UZ11_BCD004001186 [Bacteroidetes bacterium OLB11]MCC6448803.1 hypothetical protein [Chitinophagaceae bacterium]HMN32674.1 hypothetical protein [Chitinophagaceae bacterium]
MNRDTEQRINKASLGFKSSLDIGMGFLYIIIPAYAFAMPSIIEQYGKGTVYTIGGLFIFYGGFRIFRGLMALQKFFKKDTRFLKKDEK